MIHSLGYRLVYCEAIRSITLDNHKAITLLLLQINAIVIPINKYEFFHISF